MDKKSIRKVLESLGCSEFKDSGSSIQTNCPTAKWTHESGQDRRPSFGVKEEQGMSYGNCFTCNLKGGLVSIVRAYGSYAVPEGITTQEDIQELVDFILLAEDEFINVEEQIKEIPKVSGDMLSCLSSTHDYFSERGITEESVKKWNLGFYERSNRVLFPVFHDPDEDPVGIVARSISNEGDLKYRNDPPGFEKSLFLYGLWLMPETADTLLIAEGPIDVIKVNQVLEENNVEGLWCVGLMGAKPSKVQMDLLVENSKEVICILDNDSSGKVGEKQLAEGIGKRTILSFVNWPEEYEDPDEAGEDILYLIAHREFLLERRIKNTLKGLG